MIKTKNLNGKTCSVNRSIEKYMQNFSRNLKGSEQLEDTGKYGK